MAKGANAARSGRRTASVVVSGPREDIPGRSVLRGEARCRFTRAPSEEASRRLEALERASADGMHRLRDIRVG